MKILLVTSEALPYAKSGGLGDFILSYSKLIMEICCSKSYCRECVSTARFNRNTNIITKLILDCTSLGFGCSNRNLCLWIYSSNLAVHALYHRFVLIIIFEQFDELLTSNII